MLFSCFLLGPQVNAQCLEAIEGQYPDATLTPECVGVPENLVNDGYASEYSKVQLTAGVVYEFSSSVSTDFVDAAAVAGMDTPLLTFENLTTNFGSNFDTASVNFSPTTTDTYFIGFRSFSEADQGYIQIDDISVNSALSTASFDKSTVSYFPNPVKDLLYLSNVEKFNTAEIYNLLGQKVLSQNGSTSELNLSSLTSGAYVVKLKGDASVKSIKIIKK